MRHLGYSWSEAHEDAELLEHITPRRLTARLDQFLNYPQEIEVAIGNAVRIIEVGEYEGPLTLDLDGKRVQISYKAACQIYVDQTEGL